MQKRRRCRRMSKFGGTSPLFYTEPHLEGVISETNERPWIMQGIPHENQLQPRGQKEKGRSERCHVPFVPCVCVFMKQEDNERLSVGASIMKRLR